MATQPSVAVRLTIYFRPSDSIKSLLRSSINTASATRDSISWDVCWHPRPPADGRSVWCGPSKWKQISGNTAVVHPTQWTRLGASAIWNQTNHCLLLVCQLFLLYLGLFLYLKEISLKNKTLYLLIQLYTVFGPANLGRVCHFLFFFLLKHEMKSFDLSEERIFDSAAQLCKCHNLMSPSSVYARSVQNCFIRFFCVDVLLWSIVIQFEKG